MLFPFLIACCVISAQNFDASLSVEDTDQSLNVAYHISVHENSNKYTNLILSEFSKLSGSLDLQYAGSSGSPVQGYAGLLVVSEIVVDRKDDLTVDIYGFTWIFGPEKTSHSLDGVKVLTYGKSERFDLGQYMEDKKPNFMFKRTFKINGIETIPES